MNLLKRILNALILTILLTKGTTLMAQDVTQQNKQLLADFANAVFVKKDFNQLPQFMQQNYIQHNPLVPQGLSGFQAFLRIGLKQPQTGTISWKNWSQKVIWYGRMVFIQERSKVTG